MGFSRNGGRERKETRAESSGESQWVDDIEPESCSEIISSEALRRQHWRTLSTEPFKLSFSTFHGIFMNEGVRTRQEGGVNERRRIPTTHPNTPPRRWPLSGQTRDVELGRSGKKKATKNHEILLGMQARESACVDRVCVRVCVAFDIWPLIWGAPVTGVPVWADRSQTT